MLNTGDGASNVWKVAKLVMSSDNTVLQWDSLAWWAVVARLGTDKQHPDLDKPCKECPRMSRPNQYSIDWVDK